MFVEHGTTGGVVLDREVQVFQETAVAASHIADALRLLVHWAIEDLDNDLIDFLEIGLVSPTAAPHVHSPIDHEFDTVVVEARGSRIAEQKCMQRVEHREVRNRYSIGSRDLRGVVSARSQLNAILLTSDPTLRGQKIEDAGQTALVC